MVKGLYTAYTGMINQQNRLDVLTNNLANSATSGFKAEGATSQSFDEVMAVKIKDTSSAYVNKRIGAMSMGVKIGETYTDYGQGSFRTTGNTFDLALEGEGFFGVSFTNKAGEQSIKYTRDGSFTLTNDGYLVTKDGDFVQGTNGNIRINPNAEVSIDSMGNIYEDGVLTAQLEIVDFEDYDYLEKYGENMYDAVEGATVTESEANTHQGYLETSNVNVISEMVEMITVTRAYETNQKVIQTIDSTLDKAVNTVGRV